MRIKTLIAVIASAFLATSCATKVVPNSVSIPKEPAKTESVMPTIVKVQDGVDKIGVTNVKLDEKTKQQSATILSQKVQISEAIAQAEKFREKAKAQELITEIEAAELSTKLLKVQEDNIFLEKTNNELKDEIIIQKELVFFARQDARVALTKAGEKEKEADQLRVNHQVLATDLEARNKDVETMQKQVLKSEKEAAKAKTWRNMFWGLLALATLVGVGLTALKYYSPAGFLR